MHASSIELRVGCITSSADDSRGSKAVQTRGHRATDEGRGGPESLEDKILRRVKGFMASCSLVLLSVANGLKVSGQ